MTNQLTKLTESRDAALLELEAAYARQELESMNFTESYGEYVPPLERFSWDPMGYTSSPRIALPTTNIESRSRGRYSPIYETETQLTSIRAEARNLSLFTSTHTGAQAALTNYIIHTGFQYGCQIKSSYESLLPESLALKAQEVIDEFLHMNSIPNDLDREVHDRSREDGEVFLQLTPRSGRTRIDVIEPEQVTQPANPGPLEDFIDADYFQNFWDFGIHTAYNEDLKREDPNPLGYHVVYDGRGRDWDYLPPNRMFHLKRNVPRNAKRGISDFYHIQNDLEREAKLRRNTAEGAAVHASIVGIRKHAEGVGRKQVSSFQRRQAQQTRDVSVAGGGTKQRNITSFDRPHIKDIPNGMDWMAGPLGSLNHPVFIEVRQMLLRSIGIRWNMPEYIISGDASNAAFASTLVSESPFVKAMQSEQETYISYWRKILTQVLYFAWRADRLDSSIPWRALYNGLIISIDPPEVASRNELEMTQRNETLNRNRLMSKRTWAAREDLDYDEEQKFLEQEPIEIEDPELAGLQRALQGT